MMASEINTSKNIILYDGFCNLCSGAVQFVLKRDKKKKFQFAPLQSNLGKTLLQQNNLSTTDLNTLVLLEDGKLFTQSTGALKIARSLSGLWPITYWAILLPKFVRDAIYHWIAKNRYKWFGKKEQCYILPIDKN